jgi:hypothetical protein
MYISAVLKMFHTIPENPKDSNIDRQKYITEGRKKENMGAGDIQGAEQHRLYC